MSKDCLIQFYDPQKPLYIECDALKQGIGCVLLQPDDNIPSTLKDGIPTNLRPVAYASKSLSEAEQSYANIERELLGAVFAIEIFKHFTYGRLPNIITDHKPLTSLFTKCLPNTSPQLSRMLLQILNGPISHKSQHIHSVVPQLKTTLTSQPGQPPMYLP